MKLTLQTKLSISFALGLIMLSTLGFIAWRNNAQQISAAEAVTHSREAIITLEKLRYKVTDAEIGVRGFVISGDPAYLAAYQAYSSDIDYFYDYLNTTIIHTPQQSQQLKMLQRMMEELHSGSARVIQLRREKGMEAARERYVTGRASQLSDRVMQEIDTIQQRERQLVSQLVNQGRASSQRTQLAIVGGSLLALLLGIVSYFMLRRDLVLRNQAEQALQQANEQLQITSARAQQADRIKTAFLATMSHELRTPLNSIIGFSGILFQELAGPLNEEQKKQLSLVRESSRHLLALVNDVLDISRVEAGQLKVLRAAFPVNESLSRSVELVAPLAEKKGLKLLTCIAADLGEIVSDKRRLEQVLINLLSNAIKFTERGHITLSAEKIDDYIPPGEQTPQQVMRVQISDTGVGISPEQIPTLFQPFHKLEDNIDKPHNGTGLGLAISQRLLALMGGKISVESKVGEGSIFTVILPREEIPSAAHG